MTNAILRGEPYAGIRTYGLMGEKSHRRQSSLYIRACVTTVCKVMFAGFCVLGNAVAGDNANGNFVSWKEKWREEFRSKKLDMSNWSFLKGDGKTYPEKLKWHTHLTDDPIAYKFTGETLKLFGLKNPDLKKDSRPFLCGGIHSRGKRTFKYGKIEVRFRLNKAAKGSWPAIWLMPDKSLPNGEYGEIDLLERLNDDPFFYQTTHTAYSLYQKMKMPPNSTISPFDTNGWNTVGLEWYPDRLVYTTNGKPSCVWPRLVPERDGQWSFDVPFFLYIDMQLGGSWVGPIDPTTLDEPAEMEIDWVSYSEPVSNCGNVILGSKSLK